MILLEAFSQALLCCSKGLSLRVVVALSGGVDLMCLAYLLAQYRRKTCKNVEILAVTVDHAYRNGSAVEAAKVGRLVQTWGLLHRVVRLLYDKNVHSISNFEEVARAGRYAAFSEACSDFGLNQVLVAHNRDDQLETYLLRLQMNSSIFGLRGLLSAADLPVAATAPKSIHSPVTVLRPLLAFEKDAIIETCTENGVQWFEDVTNADTGVTKRNLLRHILTCVVPQRMKNEPGLSVISKDALSTTHDEVLEITESIEKKADTASQWLQTHGLRLFDPLNCSLKLEIPYWMLSDENAPVLSRLLYHEMRPVSPSPHFHWTYAKIERKAVPRLHKYFKERSTEEKTPGILKLTYMGVLIHAELDSSTQKLHLHLSRQPVIREDVPKIRQELQITSSWSKYLLLDNRFWVRARTVGTPLLVTLDIFQQHHFAQLKSDKYDPVLKSQIEGIRPLNRLLNTPILTQEERILSIPAYGLNFAPVEMEWVPKSV